MPAGLPQRVLRALADSRTADEAISATLAEIATGLGAPLADLWLLAEEDRVLVWGGDFASDPAVADFRDRSRHLTFGPGDGLPGRVVAAGVCAVIDDLGADLEFPRARVAAEVGLVRAIAAPLIGPGGPLGAVEVFAPREVELGRIQIDALDGAARQLAAYLGRVRIEQRLRVSEERNEAIVAAALDCVVTMDHTGRVVDFNPAAETTFGYPRDEAVGQVLAELIIPPEYRDLHHRSLAAYVEHGEATILDQRLELTALRRDGSSFPVELTVTRLGSARPPMFAGFVRDISERRRVETEHARLLSDAVSSRALAEAAQARSAAAQELAEQAGRRVALLARAGERMLGARDDEEIMRVILELVVPELADWCEVTVTDLDRTPSTMSAGERPPGDVLTVPLRSARRQLGSLALALRSDSDAAFARTLAARTAVAIDNAQLFAERSHIAETLQRGLLPLRLPEVPGLEVAARYRAAGQQNLVGGDFYDLFQSGDGVWTAILGDVAGKGPEAATITALTRHTLRAGALREQSPKANLLLLNEALLASLDLDWRFATVVFARICRDGDGAVITVSTGGHLPPIVLRSDGSFEDVPICGTVLGTIDVPRLDDHDVRLEPGDLMLLYTDGVTELRPGEPAYGDELLRRVLAAHSDGSVHEIVAAVEQAALDAQGGEPRDDIALIALRVPG